MYSQRVLHGDLRVRGAGNTTSKWTIVVVIQYDIDVL
jgi:hypothetical protein